MTEKGQTKKIQTKKIQMQRGKPPKLTPAAPVELKAPPGDIALVLGKDAEGLHILRRRSEESPIEAGLLRPMREGKPISGEVVSLTQRQDLPMVFDVKSEFSTDVTPGERPAVDGPAQVASDAYRKGWDAVWGVRRRERSIN
ncbi:MAG: hypothetical protein ABI560_13465 [Myxococcales bacterium]